MVTKADQWLSHVAALKPLSPRVSALILTISDATSLRFRAGQYALLSRPGGPAYPYSFATPLNKQSLKTHGLRGNNDLQLEFHISGDGPRREGEFLSQLAPGDPVVINGPFGDAYYRDDHPGPALGLAGGSGLGPIKCIAEHALSSPSYQPFYLYHGGRNPEDLYLDDHLRLLSDRHSNFHYVPALSDPSLAARQPTAGGPASPDWRIGTVCDCAAGDFTDLSGWKAYIAGPPGMVETARQFLEKCGVNHQDMHSDAL